MVKPHIIKKQVIDVELDSEIGSYSLQSEISNIYKSEILPIIDKYLSESCGESEVIRIDKLELELGYIHKNSIKRELVNQVKKILPVKLKAIKNNNQLKESGSWENYQKISTQKSDFEQFEYYIINGRNSWHTSKYVKSDYEKLVSDRLKNNFEKIKNLIIKINQDKDCLQRFSNILNNNYHPDFFSKYFKNNADNIVKLYKKIKDILLKDKTFSIYTENRLSKDLFVSILHNNSFDYNENILIKNILEYLAVEFKQNSSDFKQRILKKITEAGYHKVTEEHNKYENNDFKIIINTLNKLLKEILIKKEFTGSSKQVIEEHLKNIISKNKLNKTLNKIDLEFRNILNSSQSVKEEMISKDLKSDINKSIEQIKKIKSKEDKLELKITKDKFNDSEEIYINNSGLILFWPYLNSLFEKTNVTEDGVFVSDEHQERALVLLNYLVTGTSEYTEDELVLNKLLCGYDIEKSLKIDIEINQFDRESCDELISAVMQNWPVFRDSSHDTFRSMFIKREGVIKKRDGQLVLQVEEQALDILMDKLPWSISTVKLPWMEKILCVEWRV